MDPWQSTRRDCVDKLDKIAVLKIAYGAEIGIFPV
ncbi:hypothetical protein BMS3Abin14_01368 [bacterium BMS3Abin14]|nr:hypothetical protein BMS3Abin14_01368 [bacterium BMS3Abin14]